MPIVFRFAPTSYPFFFLTKFNYRFLLEYQRIVLGSRQNLKLLFKIKDQHLKIKSEHEFMSSNIVVYLKV